MESEITTAATLLEVSLSPGFAAAGFGGGGPPAGGFSGGFMDMESFFNETTIVSLELESRPETTSTT